MNMKVTRQTRPGTCPNHPDATAYRTETKPAAQSNVDKLIGTPIPWTTQYRCAETEFCNAPLGWEFHDPGRATFRHGPGKCQDPAVLNTIKHEKHWAKWRAVILTSLMSSAVGGIILATGIAQNGWNPVAAVALTAILAGGATATWTALRRAQQKDPYNPDFPANGAAGPDPKKIG